jgi:hypothetical protein
MNRSNNPQNPNDRIQNANTKIQNTPAPPEIIPIMDVVNDGKEYGKCIRLGINRVDQILENRDHPAIRKMFGERMNQIETMYENRTKGRDGSSAKSC